VKPSRINRNISSSPGGRRRRKKEDRERREKAGEREREEEKKKKRSDTTADLGGLPGYLKKRRVLNIFFLRCGQTTLCVYCLFFPSCFGREKNIQSRYSVNRGTSGTTSEGQKIMPVG